MSLERVGTFLSVVGALAGVWIYVESNFASAADLKRLEGSMNQAVIELRKKTVEDKIFELEFKQNQEPAQFRAIDKALLEKNKRELQELQNRRGN